MNEGVRVQIYLRPPVEGWHSVERVFTTVFENLPPFIDAEMVTVRGPARGLVGRARVLREGIAHTPGIHHVTGDVHYLVLALPWRQTVLTVHDLVHLRALRGMRHWIYRLLWFSLPLRCAAAVTVISEQVAQELTEEFPYVAAKLHRIPNPLPAGLSPSESLRASSAKHVILHVGTTENKNLDLSIAVAKRLGAELSILGRLHKHQQSVLERTGITFHAQHDVPDDSLADVYRGADVLLFASLVEGFGMPIIEAQACGVPVVTSDLEPMRSVAGHAALLIDPSDVDAAVSAVRSLLETNSLRGELVQAGLLNAARYEPKAIAAAYADVYRGLAATAN